MVFMMICLISGMDMGVFHVRFFMGLRQAHHSVFLEFRWASDQQLGHPAELADGALGAHLLRAGNPLAHRARLVQRQVSHFSSWPWQVRRRDDDDQYEAGQAWLGTLAGGRIQHTRIYDHHGGIDIINFYQRVWSHSTVGDIKAQKKKVWTALAQCLDSLPARNQVLVCGDMNTQLPYCKGATGKAVRKSTCRDSRDEHELLDILRLHGLVAVNTFHDPKPYTYSGAGSRTQLDYVFMRTNQASGLSKQARGLHQFPLLAARGDCFHVPLLARIPRRWRVWHYGSQPPRPKGPSRPELSAYIAARARDLDFHLDQVVQHEVTDINSIDKALLQAQQQMEDTMQYQRAQAQRP